MKKELGQFPYVNYGMSKGENPKEKRQYPFVPDESVEEFYRQHGHRLLNISERQEMYRFDVQKHTLSRKEGEEEKEYTNMVTLSKPSAEVVCTRINEETGCIEICLIIQPRTPYTAVVDGECYARFFMEQPAGLVEKGETLEEAAVREVEEEIGYKVNWLEPLIVPNICRHVSYTTETSRLYVAGVGKHTKQKLDENEDIKTKWKPAYEVERELEEYLEGIKDTFYGFDLPEMTILGLQRFFVKLHRGDFDELNEALTEELS